MEYVFRNTPCGLSSTTHRKATQNGFCNRVRFEIRFSDPHLGGSDIWLTSGRVLIFHWTVRSWVETKFFLQNSLHLKRPSREESLWSRYIEKCLFRRIVASSENDNVEERRMKKGKSLEIKFQWRIFAFSPRGYYAEPAMRHDLPPVEVVVKLVITFAFILPA